MPCYQKTWSLYTFISYCPCIIYFISMTKQCSFRLNIRVKVQAQRGIKYERDRFSQCVTCVTFKLNSPSTHIVVRIVPSPNKKSTTVTTLPKDKKPTIHPIFELTVTVVMILTPSLLWRLQLETTSGIHPIHHTHWVDSYRDNYRGISNNKC